MPKPENVIGKGKPFTSDNQPANRGRKPKLYTIAKKSYGISLDEFKEVVNYLWQLPKDEVKEISERGDTPIWMANVCRSLYKDTAKGVMNTLRELIQLMFGKELQDRPHHQRARHRAAAHLLAHAAHRAGHQGNKGDATWKRRQWR